ncbi:Serine palmitoyl transferase A subunit [Schizosaccharomyces pombe]|uniref:Uncharacterized membrane protein C23A1.05 n=1 Tax=Schizosaccharomyces pombe (strain 972 / ATCC 24843) TaxID=284812 RepID=YFH5_SCHPO|nr:putative serine palmitoyl transferase A subunit [Schizosaccharomyces pombe]O42843.1 RecName: Full=Uncharacterized membrane protein C23A1.05 [Schizosaccharomyces pombe 972h-]CAA16979.1 serine palmitoyl transferase A subunit (predicted) [Schizosaccharomyces pombe]|eukprot:NP_594435.1 putative serine palmitoyl transferase A subunit [Schizosaccharomyces pombe]
MGNPVVIKAKKDYDCVFEPEPMSWLRLQYYRYQVTAGTYLFTYKEAFVFNTVVFIIVFLTGWAAKSIIVKLLPSLWRLSTLIPSFFASFFMSLLGKDASSQ